MESNKCEEPFELCKEDLQCVLNKELKSSFEIENFKTEGLTKPGDNYGGTILSVEVTCIQEDVRRKVSLVAKLMPPSEFLRDAFNIKVTFNKEVRSYALVFPELKRLQEEQKIPIDEILDIFPKFYGARTNLKKDMFQAADHSAFLLLENLKTLGYTVGDRRKGLNLAHVEFVVKKLAHFHATTIALKSHKPDVFKSTVLKACEKFTLGSKFDVEKLISATIKSIKAISECAPYVKTIENRVREALEIEFVLSPVPKEPFATMLHNDFWVNNMLFKYDSSENKETPKNMKFVDFQIVVYDSPVRDILFFLFTSSEDGLLDKHLDDLIDQYYGEFIKHLDRLDCNIDDFSYDKFKNEFDIYAPREFSHILFILRVVSAENSGAQSLSESDMDMFDSNGGEVYANKVKSLILTFLNRGWL